jgi:hypothetical protein
LVASVDRFSVVMQHGCAADATWQKSLDEFRGIVGLKRLRAAAARGEDITAQTCGVPPNTSPVRLPIYRCAFHAMTSSPTIDIAAKAGCQRTTKQAFHSERLQLSDAPSCRLA